MIWVGIWATLCLQGVMRTERIEAVSEHKLRAILEEHFFSDHECKTPAYVFRSEGEVEFHPELLRDSSNGFPADARAVDFAYEKVTIRFQTEALSKWAEGKSLCGIQNWKAGVDFEVTGKSCAFFSDANPVHVPRAGEGRFGIYRVLQGPLGPGLEWGQLTREWNGESPALRPRQWDESAVYWKAHDGS